MMRYETQLPSRVDTIRLDVNRGVDRRVRFVALIRLGEYEVQTKNDRHNQHQYFDSGCSSFSVNGFQVIFHEFDVYRY